MIIGFACVSTDDQILEAQIDAQQASGVEKIFREKKTGKTRNRPELERILEHL